MLSHLVCISFCMDACLFIVYGIGEVEAMLEEKKVDLRELSSTSIDDM